MIFRFHFNFLIRFIYLYRDKLILSKSITDGFAFFSSLSVFSTSPCKTASGIKALIYAEFCPQTVNDKIPHRQFSDSEVDGK